MKFSVAFARAEPLKALRTLIAADVNMHPAGSELYSDAERAALAGAADRLDRYEAALLGIMTMDVFTRDGEEPAHAVMRKIAADALAVG